MTVAVFGATGKTGRLILDECLSRGWTCRALVRDTAKLPARAGVSVLPGDARVDDDVARVLAGAEAVLCSLGMSDISVPATDFSDSVKAIIRGMQKKKIRRIVAVASAGVLDHPTGGYRNAQGYPEYLRHVSAEHVRNYETLRDSGLEWTLMCPVFLREDIPAGRGRVAFEDLPPGSEETGYADMARTMVDLLSQSASRGKRVGIVSDR
jgi:uncharacterized protein